MYCVQCTRGQQEARCIDYCVNIMCTLYIYTHAPRHAPTPNTDGLDSYHPNFTNHNRTSSADRHTVADRRDASHAMQHANILETPDTSTAAPSHAPSKHGSSTQQPSTAHSGQKRTQDGTRPIPPRKGPLRATKHTCFSRERPQCSLCPFGTPACASTVLPSPLSAVARAATFR